MLQRMALLGFSRRKGSWSCGEAERGGWGNTLIEVGGGDGIGGFMEGKLGKGIKSNKNIRSTKEI